MHILGLLFIINFFLKFNFYFSILKDEDLLINDLSVSLGLRSELLCQNFRIDGVELNLEDKNIFTEKLIFYRLADEENLECLGESLLEFNDQSCYVIEWHYRIERQGIIILIIKSIFIFLFFFRNF